MSLRPEHWSEYARGKYQNLLRRAVRPQERRASTTDKRALPRQVAHLAHILGLVRYIGSPIVGVSEYSEGPQRNRSKCPVTSLPPCSTHDRSQRKYPAAKGETLTLHGSLVRQDGLLGRQGSQKAGQSASVVFRRSIFRAFVGLLQTDRSVNGSNQGGSYN